MTEFMKYETDIPNYMDSIISQQQRELITKQDNLVVVQFEISGKTTL